MVVTARPNILTALRSRLLTVPEIVTLVSSAAGWTDGRTEPRIASQIHGDWKMPTRAVRLRRTGGDSPDFAFGIYYPRIDVFCYGKFGHESAELMDLVFAALCPTQRTESGFTAAGCVVGSIEPEAEVYADVEPVTRYPFAWMPFRVRFCAQVTA